MLNWSYTDPQNGVAASDTVNGGLMAASSPAALTGSDTTLISGGILTSQSGFGDYTSVSIAPSPSAGCQVTALTDNEYIGIQQQWFDRIGVISFC